MPSETDTKSGRLILRIPKTLHTRLAHRAEREGVSLNQWLVAILSSAASESVSDAPRCESCGGLHPCWAIVSTGEWVCDACWRARKEEPTDAQ